ncbi:hypothetical protein ASG52_10145 [Methylobacterium sp. Leaf456]|uniref:hypothetical protein n=1 Tax=Methylobacterium sp. Leaf456 TaxID=1736382 RepID=UPI0006FEDD99|nr:hypothetical protein [Methylobacterium sp. Leaf456]KQT49308.1 hypothetical protein ASG52_10145 [Methylobacterium sp. Leaf456]
MTGSRPEAFRPAALAAGLLAALLLSGTGALSRDKAKRPPAEPPPVENPNYELIPSPITNLDVISLGQQEVMNNIKSMIATSWDFVCEGGRARFVPGEGNGKSTEYYVKCDGTPLPADFVVSLPNNNHENGARVLKCYATPDKKLSCDAFGRPR